MTYYRRNLPHWQPEGAALFLTWRLHGVLPRECFLDRIEKDPGRQFAAMDRILDTAANGPRWLNDPRVAKCVAAALRYGEAVLKLYKLRAWVIMSNHVHLLIDPAAPLAGINRSIRSYTAREANRILARAGPFWQHESYDHWARSRDEADRILRYIERNPVKAGLVQRVDEWPWSSASAPQ